MVFHPNVKTVSFQHKYEIKRVFKDILGLYSIKHFSLDLVSPEKKEMIFFSSTPSHGFEIINRGYGDYDGIISPEMYQNYEFYWWDSATHGKKYEREIINFREGVLGLHNGFMLVRNWNDFYLIFSFATQKCDVNFQTFVIDNIDEFLRMGDWAYNEMRELYSNYTGIITPPKIEQFYHYEGGIPPARYTTDYKSMKTNAKPLKSSII